MSLWDSLDVMDIPVFWKCSYKISCEVSSLGVEPWWHSSKHLQPDRGGAFVNQNTEANAMETVIIMISPAVLLLKAENHLRYYT